MDDYKAAAIRHYRDATFLKDSGRNDNAGHLIGFAAECAIKYRITSLAGSTKPHGHLPEFLNTAKKHLVGRSSHTHMYTLICGDIFKTWNVNRRYATDSNTNQNEIKDWFRHASALLSAASIKAK